MYSIGRFCKRPTAIAIYRNAFLIYNPHAGGLRYFTARRVSRVLEVLRAAGHSVTALATPAPGEAAALARRCVESGADLVLALGGDGTLNEAANGMVGTQVPLCVIPAGTANVLARELGLPRRSTAAAARLATLEPLRIPAGLLRASGLPSPRYFLLMAGAGFDGHIVYHLNLGLKARLGELAYWVSAARELARRLDEFHAEAGGRRFRCSFALASRVKNYAGYMRIATGASLLRDDFQVAIFEGRSTLRYYSLYLFAVLAGLTATTPGITYLYSRRVDFYPHNGPDIYVQVDGEFAGRLPASVEVVPDALTILVPPSFRSSG
ncbi:MAG: diacylglycerol/lipid kinase family protein [Bryobacteraceae bacterium]